MTTLVELGSLRMPVLLREIGGLAYAEMAETLAAVIWHVTMSLDGVNDATNWVFKCRGCKRASCRL